MSPNPNRFGRLLAGHSVHEAGAVCARCNKGGGYLVGEEGEERHLRCWQDDPTLKGARRRKKDRGPQLFDPDAPAA